MPSRKKKSKSKSKSVRLVVVDRTDTRMMIRPGSEAFDPVTGFKGYVTHWYVELDGTRGAVFQPSGTLPDSTPHESYTVHPMRLTRVTLTPEIYLPLELLGQEVTHKITDIKGTVLALAVHSTGCVHLELQPKGTTKDGKKHKVRNFEINECKGHPLLDHKTQAQIDAERAETPSPMDYPVERAHFQNA